MLNIQDPKMADDPLEPLFRVAERFARKGIASYVEVISSAKVPIIKMDHASSGISFDILLNNSSGLETGRLIRRYVKRFPQLRPLAITLKIYLVNIFYCLYFLLLFYSFCFFLI
jgi:DNA polymerase sigma